MNAVLSIGRTGEHWREIPETFSEWNSVFQRYNRWSKAGVWERVFHALSGDQDFEYVMIDSTIVRAPALRWCNRGTQETEVHRRSKGGLTTKLHAAVDGPDNPLRFILTPGQASDYTQVEPLPAGFPLQNIIADKGYDSKKIVDTVELTGAKAVIPPRSCVKDPREPDFALYAERDRIECFFSKLKHYRVIATRYAKRARNFASLIYLAASMLWIK